MKPRNSESVNDDGGDLDEATLKLITLYRVRAETLEDAIDDDEHLDRTHLKALSAISRTLNPVTMTSWLGRAKFAEQMWSTHAGAGAGPKKLKTVSNHLAELRGLGWITSERRPTPQAGNRILQHHTLARLTAEITKAMGERKGSVVPFKGGDVTSHYRGKSAADVPTTVGSSHSSGDSISNNSSRNTHKGESAPSRAKPPVSPATILADLSGSSDFACTTGMWRPIGQFRHDLEKKYPLANSDIDAITGIIIADILKVPRGQSLESLKLRIHGKCLETEQATRSASKWGNTGAQKAVAALSEVRRLERPTITGRVQFRGDYFDAPSEFAERVREAMRSANSDEEREKIFERECKALKAGEAL